MIDGTIVQAHKHAAGARGGQPVQGLGRSCGGFSSKIHAKVDNNGMPLKFIISAGEEADINFASQLIGEDCCNYLLADRGYDSDKFRTFLKEKDISPVIPGRRSRINEIVYDHDLYKHRNVVERFFGRIKEFRRIATRYDKLSSIFHASLALVSILLWC